MGELQVRAVGTEFENRDQWHSQGLCHEVNGFFQQVGKCGSVQGPSTELGDRRLLRGHLFEVIAMRSKRLACPAQRERGTGGFIDDGVEACGHRADLVRGVDIDVK